MINREQLARVKAQYHALVHPEQSGLALHSDATADEAGARSVGHKVGSEALHWTAPTHAVPVHTVHPLCDTVLLRKERDARVLHRIHCRLLHLAALPHKSLQEAIEEKALRLAERQHLLRAQLVSAFNKSSLLGSPSSLPKQLKKHSLDASRRFIISDRTFRKSRADKDKSKHADFIASICSTHLKSFNLSKLGSNVLKLHAKLEKDEQLRLQKLKQDRLIALKSNDEQAYLKLVNKAKDSRITLILNQTSSFLQKLTGAVRNQQGNNIGTEEDEDVSERYGTTGLDGDEYYNTAHKIKEKIVEQPKILEGGKLKEYQIIGLEWMVSLYNNQLNGILADEMGLGKTIQSISLITYLIEKKNVRGPFLVVVPLSTISNWVNEFEKWAPSVSKIVYKGPPPERKRQADRIRSGNYNVLLTTYDYIIKDKNVLSKPTWTALIIDEGHRMKNTQSKLSTTLIQFYRCRYRLILTGTPLQNNLPELWALLNFILPKVFNSVSTFDEWFNSPFSSTMGQDNISLNEEEQLLIIKRLHKVLRPFLLRRLKKDVEKELPDKVETVIKVKMSALQILLYENSRNKRSFLEGNQRALLQNLMMHFRKICNHPFVCEPVEDHFTSQIDDTIFRVSGKFEWLDRVLPKLMKTGHRVLMFFQMTAVMNVMSDYLAWRGMNFLRLDGSVKPEERERAMKEFNKPESDIFVFLLSTRAGGLGLNLQSADTVIIFDSDWNPHQDLQAQDRAHRIGQTKEVRIYRLVTLNSIEEHILARAQFKLDIDKKVIQGGKFDQKTTDNEREEMLRALFNTEQDDKNEEDECLEDDELNEILARNDDELNIFRQMDIERYTRDEVTWREKGRSGPPQRLIQFEELPESLKYPQEIDKDGHQVVEMGRGARDKKSVRYRDLKDDEYFEILERGEDPDDMQRQIEEKKRKRESNVVGASSSSSGGLKRGRKEVGGGGKDKQRRKRKKSPSGVDYEKEDTLDPQARANMTRVFMQILNTVRDLQVTDSSGYTRTRSILFLELPSSQTYPHYYTLIKKPISFTELEKRINSTHYDTASQFREDFKLMFDNARIFNLEGSDVYVDANEMEKCFEAEYHRLCPGGRVADGGEREVKRRKKRVESDSEDDDVGRRESTGMMERLGIPGFQSLPSIKLRKEVEHEDGEISD